MEEEMNEIITYLKIMLPKFNVEIYEKPFSDFYVIRVERNGLFYEHGLSHFEIFRIDAETIARGLAKQIYIAFHKHDQKSVVNFYQPKTKSEFIFKKVENKH